MQEFVLYAIQPAVSFDGFSVTVTHALHVLHVSALNLYPSYNLRERGASGGN